MLKEVIPTRQIPGEPPRTWYLDDEMDLIVWAPKGSAPVGFQISSREGHAEKALSWFEGRGYSRNRVDDGEGWPGHYKMAPVLLEDVEIDAAALRRRFLAKARDLPAEIRDFVLARLQPLADADPNERH